MTKSAPTPAPGLLKIGTDLFGAVHVYDEGGDRLTNDRMSGSEGWKDTAALIVKAVSSHAALVARLTELIEAIDSGNLEMNSPEVGPFDPDIPAHRWHEEWLHRTRAALKSSEGGGQ